MTQVEVKVDSSNYPLIPAQICNTKFEVFGVYRDGSKYEANITDEGCGAGAQGATFTPDKLYFQKDSLLCGVITATDGKKSAPACVKLTE